MPRTTEVLPCRLPTEESKQVRDHAAENDTAVNRVIRDALVTAGIIYRPAGGAHASV